MISLSRVEVPPNFGVNLVNLNRIRNGKILEIASRVLNPFGVVDRIGFRASIDAAGLSDISPRVMTTSRGSLVATAAVGVDASVSISMNNTMYKLSLGAIVSCIGFIGDHLLVTGCVNGDLEAWQITVGKDGVHEAKCLYKFNCGKANAYPLFITANQEAFQVILNRGKAMLVFDTVAVVSGNTDESVFSPVIIDLLQSRPVLDCAIFDSLVASLNPASVTVTDTLTHKAVSWEVIDGERCFWSETVGHLFIVTQNGDLVDAAWSNGLVGVSTIPNSRSIASGNKPVSVERTGLSLNPLLVDIRDSFLVTVKGDDLVLYSIKSSRNPQFPISSIVTEFQLEKQVPIQTNANDQEVIIAARLCEKRTCAVLIQNQQGSVRIVNIGI